jgi:hypothetical protein
VKFVVGKTYICDCSDLEVTILNNPYGNKYKLLIENPGAYSEIKYYTLDPSNIKHWRVK